MTEKWGEIKGKEGLVGVSGEFKLPGFYCILHNTRSYISYPRGITVNPGDTLANKNDSLSQGTFSFRHFSSFNFVLTLSIKLTQMISTTRSLSVLLTWENSRHFWTPSLVSRSEVWETSAKIPYWLRLTAKILACVAGVNRGRERGNLCARDRARFLSFLPRAPKFPLPPPLLTPATQASKIWVVLLVGWNNF